MSEEQHPDVVRIDTRALSMCRPGNERTARYRRGLEIANQGERDSFLKQCRYNSLQQLVEHVLREDPTEEFAEVGCFQGHSTYIIASILAQHGHPGPLHVFDSFEGGLSDRQPEDKSEIREMSAEGLELEKQWFSSSEEHVSAVLSEFGFCKLYRGWVPDRFSEVADRRFALVHVDVDLYQPTLDSLRFFFPRLKNGGVLVVDDYGWRDFPGAGKAVDEFRAECQHRLFYELPVGSAFIVK